MVAGSQVLRPRRCERQCVEQSDFVIIGGVACGPKTAAALARRLPEASITLFQKETRVSYGTCGMPYFASGDIGSFDELTFTSYGVPRDTTFFKQTKGFDVVTGAEVTAIDRKAKTVTVRTALDGSTRTHRYGKLVIATGAAPNNPPFKVPQSDRVRYFTRPDDAINFRKLAQTGQVGSAVVIGGGFIGCEVVEAAAGLWGIETTLIEKENQVLPYVLDPEMAAMVEREMARQDVRVLTGRRVTEIALSDDGSPVVSIDGEVKISADYVFLCLGVHPEVTLARDAGLVVGEFGGIEVDEHMRTSDENIYAGGDCVESVSQVTGKRMYIPMGSVANRHGRVVAENLAGKPASFPPVTGAFLVKVFEANVGAVGLSELTAMKHGLNARVLWGTFPDKPDYYPESNVFTLKMVYERDSERLLGLQAVGAGDICRRIDVFSSMLRTGATIGDLLDFEQGYAPPYAEALDPLFHLGCMARAQSRGASFIPPAVSVHDVQFIDVREEEETEQEPWSSVSGCMQPVNIPLGDLRRRLDELDRTRKTVIVCKRGPRSFQAAAILKAAGFADVDILAGGLQSLK